MLVPSIGYNKNLIPLPVNGENYTFINFSSIIRETIFIDEEKEIMRLKTQQIKEWYNSYLTFQNLKENSINIIESDDKNNMWLPRYDSINTENRWKCERTDEAETFKVVPQGNFNFALAKRSVYRNSRIFKAR